MQGLGLAPRSASAGGGQECDRGQQRTPGCLESSAYRSPAGDSVANAVATVHLAAASSGALPRRAPAGRPGEHAPPPAGWLGPDALPFPSGLPRPGPASGPRPAARERARACGRGRVGKQRQASSRRRGSRARPRPGRSAHPVGPAQP